MEPGRKVTNSNGWNVRSRGREDTTSRSCIGTPTDAPPGMAHAEYSGNIARRTPTGQRATTAAARKFNYASRGTANSARQIAEQLARRFGHDPNVIGWQIGNEYAPMSPSTTHDTLHSRSGSAASTKRWTPESTHWTTAYWSQTYDNWAEIPHPSAGGQSRPDARSSPHFVTATWRDFQQNADRRPSRARRPAPIHHHQHRGPGVDGLGPLCDHAAARPSPLGTIMWAKGMWMLHAMAPCHDFDARLETPRISG